MPLSRIVALLVRTSTANLSSRSPTCSLELANRSLALRLLLRRRVERKTHRVLTPRACSFILVGRKSHLSRRSQQVLHNVEREKRCRGRTWIRREQGLHRLHHSFLTHLTSVLEPDLCSSAQRKQSIEAKSRLAQIQTRGAANVYALGLFAEKHQVGKRQPHATV